MKRTILFVVLLTTVIVLHRLQFLAPLEVAIESSIGTVSDLIVGVVRCRGLQECEIASLRSRVASLESLVAKSEYARIENESLKKLIGYRDSKKAVFVPARILGKSTDPERSMIVIDRGAGDGVQKGSAVVANEGVLIGRVAFTDRERSFVMLLNDNRSKVIATFAGTSRPRGLVVGQFQLGLKMDLIPIAEKITTETILLTSGQELGIPGGLVIGRVAEVQSKPTDLFQSARITPSVLYDDLFVVGVLASSPRI